MVAPLTSENPHTGSRSLLIHDEPTVVTEALFDARPEVGELVEREIGAGLSSRVPLALFSQAGKTLGPEPPYSLATLLAQLDEVVIDSLAADDESVRLGDIVIAWNVFQHFYPYFDVVDVDWDAQLTHIQDGHGRVTHSSYMPQGRLPLLLDWIEGRVVVTRSLHEEIERGDIVERLDGVGAERGLLDAERYISGSPQWKRFRALRSFGAGDVRTLWRS